jgi:hypothetical protein
MRRGRRFMGPEGFLCLPKMWTQEAAASARCPVQAGKVSKLRLKDGQRRKPLRPFKERERRALLL